MLFIECWGSYEVSYVKFYAKGRYCIYVHRYLVIFLFMEIYFCFTTDFPLMLTAEMAS